MNFYVSSKSSKFIVIFKGVCDCPANWILNADEITCEPNPELIRVECSQNKMKVEFDETIFGPSGDEVKLAFSDTSVRDRKKTIKR